MIRVTRINGHGFAVNHDLIERVEETPDTVITLVDGTKYVVQESIDEIIDLVRAAKAEVVARSQQIEVAPSGPALRVLPNPDAEV